MRFHDRRLSPPDLSPIASRDVDPMQSRPAPIVADRQQLATVGRPRDPTGAGDEAGRDVASSSAANTATHTSPATQPRSLQLDEMKAICLPSGDHTGSATCRFDCQTVCSRLRRVRNGRLDWSTTPIRRAGRKRRRRFRGNSDASRTPRFADCRVTRSGSTSSAHRRPRRVRTSDSARKQFASSFASRLAAFLIGLRVFHQKGERASVGRPLQRVQPRGVGIAPAMSVSGIASPPSRAMTKTCRFPLYNRSERNAIGRHRATTAATSQSEGHS